jgi:serine/threonine-protein kinase
MLNTAQSARRSSGSAGSNADLLPERPQEAAQPVSPAPRPAEPFAPNVVPIRIEVGHDPLDGFSAEAPAEATRAARVSHAVKAKWMLVFGACFAALAVVAAAFYVRVRVASRPTAQALSGHAVLRSRPDGAAVIIDGVDRGPSPVELDLITGAHEVIFRTESAERRIELKVDGGTRVVENVDMPARAPSAGALEIDSDPAGARVTVDGTTVGMTPLKLGRVTPARHTVAVTQGPTTVKREVEVLAGATATVFLSLTPKASAVTGTLTVDSPLDLRILEKGQLVGLTNAAPITLAPGKHQLELVSEALEFRVSRSVVIDSNTLARFAVAAPNGTLSVNASPWAEVFVDGRSFGLTPLGSISLPIGSHEVVWRHPQLGEKRQTVVVGAQKPARATVDLNP